VVFIVKEEEGVRPLLRPDPGADRATHGFTLDGRRIPLCPAPDVQPHDITHGFSSALYARRRADSLSGAFFEAPPRMDTLIFPFRQDCPYVLS
jgi:hypothetical protein